MPEKRRKYDQVFREGAVCVVRETGKSVAQVAEDLGIPKETLANWVGQEKMARGEKLDPRRVDPERLRQTFRPEFLNRIDDVIVFHELSKDEITEIIDLYMRRCASSWSRRASASS
jgi:transposase-like protein